MPEEYTSISKHPETVYESKIENRQINEGHKHFCWDTLRTHSKTKNEFPAVSNRNP